MNFFHNLTRSTQDHGANTDTAGSSSPFDYLADRSEQPSTSDQDEGSPKLQHEQLFQERVAAAMELESWIRPLLSDLQAAAYDQDKVFGFIHWINQDDDCPWILLTPNLQYGPRHQGARADLIHWETHPQPAIHWRIGSYPDHPYAREQTWAFRQQVDIEVLFRDNQPHLLKVQVGDHRIECKECKPRLLDLTKALVQLHP